MKISRMLAPSITVIGLAFAATACSGTSALSASDGLDTSIDVKSMVLAWNSGACPASGRGWGGFDYGITVPSSAPSGARLTVVPTGVDRILLCRFSGAQDELTGAALETEPAAVSRIAHDLNSVTAGTDSCSGAQRVMLLAGKGADVIGIDISTGGCASLTSLAGGGDYRATSLERDIDAALAK